MATPRSDRYETISCSCSIKKRDSGAVMQDYLNDIKPAVKACGLTFPTPRELDLAMPDDLDWSLDGVRESDAGRWQEPARMETAS